MNRVTRIGIAKMYVLFAVASNLITSQNFQTQHQPLQYNKGEECPSPLSKLFICIK